MSDNCEILDLYASQQCCILSKKGITMKRILFLRVWSPWKWSEVKGKPTETWQDVKPPSGGTGPRQCGWGYGVCVCLSWGNAGLKKTQVYLKKKKKAVLSAKCILSLICKTMRTNWYSDISSCQDLTGDGWGVYNSTKSHAETISVDFKNLGHMHFLEFKMSLFYSTLIFVKWGYVLHSMWT